MPKLTKQAFINKNMTVPLPSERLIGWAIRRYIQLRMRHRIKVTSERHPQLVSNLKEYFNNLGQDQSEVEGQFFWVADYKTIHMGPCLFCMEQETRFREKGASMSTLLNIMESQACLSWHWNSRRGPGRTYSRVLNAEQANSGASPGLGLYGAQAPEGQHGGFYITDQMRRDVSNIVVRHKRFNREITKQQVLDQLRRESESTGRQVNFGMFPAAQPLGAI